MIPRERERERERDLLKGTTKNKSAKGSTKRVRNKEKRVHKHTNAAKRPELSKKVDIFLNCCYASCAIKKTLRNRKLQTACEASPRASAINAQLEVLMLSCEAE